MLIAWNGFYVVSVLEEPFPKAMIDFTEIGPSFLKLSGSCSANLVFWRFIDTHWCLIAELKLISFCIPRIADVDGFIHWIFHLCQWLHLVSGYVSFQFQHVDVGWLEGFLLNSPGSCFWGSGADAPYHGLDMLFHAAGKFDTLKFESGPNCISLSLHMFSFSDCITLFIGVAQVGIRSPSWKKRILATQCWPSRGDTCMNWFYPLAIYPLFPTWACIWPRICANIFTKESERVPIHNVTWWVVVGVLAQGVPWFFGSAWG